MGLEKIPPDKITSSTLPIPDEVQFANEEKINSWFSIKRLDTNHVSVPDTYEGQTEYMKCKQIRLYPTKDQRSILMSMFQTYRRIYNFALKEFKQLRHIKRFEIILRAIMYNFLGSNAKKARDKTIAVTKLKTQIEEFSVSCPVFQEIQSAITDRVSITQKYQNIKKKAIKFNEILNESLFFLDKQRFRDYIKTCLPDSLKMEGYVGTYSQAIFDVVKSYDSAMGLKRAGIIKHFRLRYKKKSNPKLCLVIESQNFSKDANGFYISTIKNIKSSSSLKGIDCDCRLVYNANTNKFILNVPCNYTLKIKTKRNEICSLDPGVRAFQTVYSEGNCFQVGRDLEKLSVKVEKINRVHKILCLIGKKKPINVMFDRNTNKAKFTVKETVNKIRSKDDRTKDLKKKLKKFLSRLRSKVSNQVKDMHYKTALFLCNRFQTILIGNMSTKSITNKRKTLNKKTKRMCLALSHYKFRYIMQHMASKRGNEISVVDESYTSKTCGRCGNIKKLCGQEFYNCDICGLVINRDVNGARNILIKNT